MRKYKLTNIIVITIFAIILGSSIGFVSFGNEQSVKNNTQNLISYGSREQKNIALTFDDGPHSEYTAEILDLLNEYDIKATFFVLGKLAEQYPDIVKRQVAEGHEIGNHTYSHINVHKSTRRQFEEEFNKTQEIILSLTGINSKVFRPPYGNLDEKIVPVTSREDSKIVLWSQNKGHNDWSNPGVEKISNTILSQAKNGDIILLHDNVYHKESHTIEALKTILPELKKRGYNFVTVSELAKLSQ